MPRATQHIQASGRPLPVLLLGLLLLGVVPEAGAWERYEVLPSLSIYSTYGETVYDFVPVEGTQTQQSEEEFVLAFYPRLNVLLRWPRQTLHLWETFSLMHHIENPRLDGLLHVGRLDLEHELGPRTALTIGAGWLQVFLLPQDRGELPVGRDGIFENGYEDARRLGAWATLRHQLTPAATLRVTYRYARYRFTGEDQTDFFNRAYVPTSIENTWALQVYRHGNYAVARRVLGADARLDEHVEDLNLTVRLSDRFELRSEVRMVQTFLNRDEMVLDLMARGALFGELLDGFTCNLWVDAEANLNNFSGLVGSRILEFEPLDANYKRVGLNLVYLIQESWNLDLTGIAMQDTYRRVNGEDVLIAGVYFRPVYHYNDSLELGLTLGRFWAESSTFDQISFFVNYTWRGLSSQ